MLRQNMNRHKSIASSARRTGRQYDLAVTRQIAVLFLGCQWRLNWGPISRSQGAIWKTKGGYSLTSVKYGFQKRS